MLFFRAAWPEEDCTAALAVDAIDRAEQQILVHAYGLTTSSKAVVVLGTTSWEEVYGMFYDRLGGGRGLRTFRYNIAPHSRFYDADIDNSRKGWWQKPLTRLEQAVFDSGGCETIRYLGRRCSHISDR